MFKFGFSKDSEDKETDTGVNKSIISWIPASKVTVLPSQIETKYESDDYIEFGFSPNRTLKLIRSDKALQCVSQENCQNIIDAESQHSDLIPAKYEGGLKIWECSYDLAQYIYEEDIELQNKIVLDLGCGAGMIGLIALLNHSTVHFQDYNAEVIKIVTIPNVLLNFEDRQKILEKCEFYSGDWESFATLSCAEDKNEAEKYDLIFTSETIYNPDNHLKLYGVFKQRLKQDGIGFIAGKSYYFGVGGGMRQFQNLIEEDGMFDVKVVWRSREGLQREILQITRKQRVNI